MATVTIKIIEDSPERYTLRANNYCLGRQWDNISEGLNVIFPQREIDNGSACTMIVVSDGAQIDSISVSHNEPFDITNVLSRHKKVLIGFMFQSANNYVKNTEIQCFYFADALKPEPFIPATPEQEQQINILLGNAFVNVNWKDGSSDTLEFRNLSGGVVKELKLRDIQKPYTALNKKESYHYDIYYNSIDYDYADKFFETKRPSNVSGLCSAVRNGNFIGGNLDWLYSENAGFTVMIPKNSGRYATIGNVANVTSGGESLTQSFVDSGEYSELYRILPFMITDGWNEFGVHCKVNVVPRQKNNGNLINPSSTVEKTICQSMFTRYIIDNFKTATDAVNYISQHLAIYPSKPFIEQFNYDQHFIISDKTKTYLVEFVDSEYVIIDMTAGSGTALAGKSYMTNFYLDGVTFNQDGKVYTPADVANGHLPTRDNGITSLGSGLERYNLIVDNYDNANTKQGMRNLMSSLFYTRAYSTSPNPSNPYWFTEFVGDGLTVDSLPADYTNVVNIAGQKFENRSRDSQSENFGTWQTVHSCVYDYENMKMYLIAQESDIELEYDFSFTITKTSDLHNDGDGTSPYATKQDIQSLEITKQDKLIAGQNITIDENNVISATGGGSGTPTNVKINGQSITQNNEADIITKGIYDAQTNPIATEADLPIYEEATTSQSGLMSAQDKTKLNGIESGAQVNTVTSVNGRTGAVTGLQNTISDLSTIRSNAESGKGASDTIATYGNIVTHNTDEFATSEQGTLADTALQPSDNITELTNNAGYTKVEPSTTNGNIKINDDETTVYTLPSDVLKQGDVVNNVDTAQPNKPLSANMGKELQDQINNLKSRGRYLSIWNCTTGLAETTPTVDPYEYRAGDYFIVGIVDKASQYLEYNPEITYNIGSKCSYNGQYYICNTNGTTGTWDSSKWVAHTIVNYRPSGTTYSASVPSTTIETADVKVNDTYYYDGTTWTLLDIGQVASTFGSLGGSPYDNSNLASALNAKQNLIDSQNKLNSDLVDDTNQTNKFVTESQKTKIDNAVQDVRIGTTSIVSSGVATIPIGDHYAPGAFAFFNGRGITAVDGFLYISAASSSDIDAKSNRYRPLVPSTLDYAIEKGLGANTLSWTDVEKTSARDTIGASAKTTVYWLV